MTTGAPKKHETERYDNNLGLLRCPAGQRGIHTVRPRIQLEQAPSTTMKRNTTKPWSLIRRQLFTLMQERRRHVDTFTVEQIYWFIDDTACLCKAPESKEAEEAANLIHDTGSFRMVADTMDDFVALVVPSDEVAGDEKPESNPAEFDAAINDHSRAVKTEDGRGKDDVQPNTDAGDKEEGLPEEPRQYDSRSSTHTPPQERPQRGASFRRHQN